MEATAAVPISPSSVEAVRPARPIAARRNRIAILAESATPQDMSASSLTPSASVEEMQESSTQVNETSPLPSSSSSSPSPSQTQSTTPLPSAASGDIDGRGEEAKVVAEASSEVSVARPLKPSERIAKRSTQEVERAIAESTSKFDKAVLKGEAGGGMGGADPRAAAKAKAQAAAAAASVTPTRLADVSRLLKLLSVVFVGFYISQRSAHMYIDDMRLLASQHASEALSSNYRLYDFEHTYKNICEQVDSYYIYDVFVC